MAVTTKSTDNGQKPDGQPAMSNKRPAGRGGKKKGKDDLDDLKQELDFVSIYVIIIFPFLFTFVKDFYRLEFTGYFCISSECKAVYMIRNDKQ